MRIRFLLFFLFGFCSQYQFAQDTTLTIKEVEIKGNRIDMQFSKTNRSASLLNAKEIKQLPVYSPQEALSYISGVDIRSRGVFGVQSDIGIRGGSFEQTQVLLNGLKLSDPQTGHHMLNLPIPLSMIKRMEVLKGPGAVKYGQNAFSGAVNLVVEPLEKDLLSFSAMYGEYNTYSLATGVNLSSQNFNHLVGVSYQSSDGYRPNADFENSQLFYMGQLNKGLHQLEIMGGGTWRKFGAGSFYVPDSEEYEEINTLFTGIKYTLQKGNWKFMPQAYYRYNDDHYMFIRSAPTVFQNFHFSNVFGVEAHASYTSNIGTTGVGFEYRNENLNSTNLGKRNRNISGLFIEQRVYLDKLNFTPGIYLNNYSDFGMFAFPALDAGYEINSNWNMYGSIGKSFRVPSYTDLYYAGPNNIGNPNLLPEQAWTYEGGLKLNHKLLNTQVGIFNRNASELIDWIKETPIAPWQPQNFFEVNLLGLEASLSKKNFQIGKVTFPLFSIDYTYIKAELFKTNAAASRYALSNLRHQIIGRLVHPIFKGLYHSISYRYLERISLPSYHLLDNRLYWQEKDFQIFIDVSNITNTIYTEAGFVPMPGRWIKIGFNWDIEMGS